jgi:hypothetical protein
MQVAVEGGKAMLEVGIKGVSRVRVADVGRLELVWFEKKCDVYAREDFILLQLVNF